MRLRPGAPSPPSALPIGRAAQTLRSQGVNVVFGERAVHGRLEGFEVRDDQWVPTLCVVQAALDRFGSFTAPEAYQSLLEGLGSTPVVNPPRLTSLLRDKVATQTYLAHLGMPEMLADVRRSSAALRRWGGGFLKPRFGSFGRGVHRVTTWRQPRAVVDRVDQPLLVQRAVPPPEGYAGVSLRILVQRGPDGPIVYPPVARVSRTDAVVNRARGAEVFPAEDVFPATVPLAQNLARRVMECFPEAVELGVDAVVDPQGCPHLIEVNSRPRGRLAALAASWPERFADLHQAAVRRPLEAVARLGA